jgi:hypothetical protein
VDADPNADWDPFALSAMAGVMARVVPGAIQTLFYVNYMHCLVIDQTASQSWVVGF